MRKNRNISFVHNLILSNSCEFYYDDISVASFVKDKYGDVTAMNSILLFIFCRQHDFAQMLFMLTSVVQDQQYMFVVRSLLVVEKVLLMKKT